MDQISEAIEAFRTGFPIALFAIVPVLLIVVSPIGVDASHDFKVYRMQQYDLLGNTHGCRSALVNSESRTLQSSSITRKCVMIRSSELTYANYLEVLDRGPSAILVLMQGNMSNEQIENFITLETEMLNSQSNVPVYFTYEDRELKDIYERVTRSTKLESGSAFQALIDSATSVGYQLVANTGQSKPMYELSLVNIEGVLPGLGAEDQLPTIAIVAHYDAFGVAPLLSYGANSDASGVVALLEVARILGKYYSSPRTHPKFNVLFLLSGGGKFNYQGSRKWLEEGLDNTGGSINESPSALLANTKLVICLDSLATRNSNSLRMHVSKPPSVGTAAASLHSNIIKLARTLDPEIDTSLVHKKIRLSSDMRAWEHERYSIRRLHAITLSTLDAYDNPLRRSILDTKDEISMNKLTQNIEILAESVVKLIYNSSEDEDLNLTSGDYGVHRDRVLTWMSFLTSQPRPAQTLNEDHPVVTSLEATLQKYLNKGSVQKTLFKTDKRDPEFLFYDTHSVSMSASIVRSAVFDLYVALVVLAYVSAIYLLIAKFNGVLFLAKKFNSLPKIKVH